MKTDDCLSWNQLSEMITKNQKTSVRYIEREREREREIMKLGVSVLDTTSIERSRAFVSSVFLSYCVSRDPYCSFRSSIVLLGQTSIVK